LKYAICGGSGFIGKALARHWLLAGHEVLIIGRTLPESAARHPKQQYLTWSQLKENPAPAEGCHALINLAGASLSQRWTAAGKTSILDSRLETVAAAAKLLDSLVHKPSVVIQSSAVAIYGTSWTESFDESSPSRVMDFPSGVVEEWEVAADRSYTNIRLIKLRTGVVLGNGSGAFPKMKLPYLLGVGGSIGSGKQWLSWIHLDDIVALIDFCAANPELSGPVNATAPQPVTNEEFGKTLGKVYHRPHWLPLPSFVLKTALGELAEILLLGQRVLPSKALEHGFVFAYPGLRAALEQLKSQ